MKNRSFYFKMIASSLARRKSRMLVAMLAIVVGATVLSGLVLIYFDMPRQMGMQFRNYGANMILVPQGEAEGLSQDEIDNAVGVIKKDQVVGVAAYHYANMTVNSFPVIVAGTDLAAVQETSPFWYVTGEWPDAPGEVLVGQEEAETYDLGIGDTVTFTYVTGGTGGVAVEGADTVTQTAEFTVAGTLDTGGTEEEYFFISADDMAAIVGEDMLYDVAELSIQATSEELAEYETAIEATSDNVNAQLVKRVTRSETTVLSKLQALVFLVTIIVLALTMICVATTMTAVVTERRKEIALKKALGAQDKEIVGEFMGEGLMLGAIGGLLGSILGFGMAQLISNSVFNSAITFRPLIVPATIVAALIVTAIACYLPVRNATKVDPAVVLKGE